MRIVVSGGGTAGHISPILATCDALTTLDKSTEILYLGQAHGMEAKIAAASGLRFAAIKAGKFRRYHSASLVGKIFNLRTLGPNLRDLGRMLAGWFEAWHILRDYKPAVVFTKGGFVGLPVGLAARVLRIPLVIHESDVSPGLANRILGRFADRIAVGFPVRFYRDLDAGRLVFTGNPVRPELMRAHRLEGLAKFQLDGSLPVLFVTGGSGGAAQINDVIIEALPGLLEFCQIIHLTGEGEYERVKFEVRRLGSFNNIARYRPFGFLHGDMAMALAAADVVVARAGANTIAELAVLGKSTILIPNYQMAGHQVENARVLSRSGAVRVLDGSKLTSARLIGEVRRILGDSGERERLEKAIRQFGDIEAARTVAALILETGREGDFIQKPNNDIESKETDQ